jgi:hypothetical protein
VADLFGRASFAAVAKFMPLFFVLQGIGLEAMGQSMDRTGSYELAYMMFFGLNVLAVFSILSIRRPRIRGNGLSVLGCRLMEIKGAACDPFREPRTESQEPVPVTDPR